MNFVLILQIVKISVLVIPVNVIESTPWG